MTSHITTSCLPQSETETAVHPFDNWFGPIEAGLRGRIRGFLQAMLEAELDAVLARSRYARRAKTVSEGGEGGVMGHRHGHRQDDRMKKPSAADLPAPHAFGRRADRRLLLGRHQRPPGATGAGHG